MSGAPELERALAAAGIGAAATARRRPSPYRTSFPLEEVEVTRPGGETVRLAWKRLDRESLGEEARLAKPSFLHDPAREPAVYASVLPQGPPGPPRLLAGGEGWLLLEWVEGRELYQVGERRLWEAAAAWLARFHAALADDPERCRAAAGLVEHDAAFYRGWMERAGAFARQGGDRRRIAAVEWLAERHEAVFEPLLAAPRTVLHGEFYASNVLVAGAEAAPRVAPVDWEVAAVGPGVTDLAALVAGAWPEEDRAAIAAAYGEPGAPLDHARAQLAIQWLGWAPPGWEPPAEQRHDWLAEALELAEGIGA